MTTFNVDSLDFTDDEEARFGADADFATRINSLSGDFEVADLTNGTTASVPTGVSTDLLSGKFAQTVSEGKALADDGNVYDTIQAAENAASSWVRVGPGTFTDPVTIDTNGMTLVGSGEGTVLNKRVIVDLGITGVTIDSMRIEMEGQSGTAVRSSGEGTLVRNLHIVSDTDPDTAIKANADQMLIDNCRIDGFRNGVLFEDSYSRCSCVNSIIENSSSTGCNIQGEDHLCQNNIIDNSAQEGIFISDNDCIVRGNVVRNSAVGIDVIGIDNLVAKNRVYNNDTNISDSGTQTLLDANITT